MSQAGVSNHDKISAIGLTLCHISLVPACIVLLYKHSDNGTIFLLLIRIRDSNFNIKNNIKSP